MVSLWIHPSGRHRGRHDGKKGCKRGVRKGLDHRRIGAKSAGSDDIFRQVGGSGDSIRNALDGMARSLRSNPGIAGLIEQLGVKVTGRDTSDVMMDLVSNLKQMPFYMAKQYASMFGIDEDTLFQMMDGLDKIRSLIL